MTCLPLLSPSLWLAALGLGILALALDPQQPRAEMVISLPAPAQTGGLTVAGAISKRRTIRRFAQKPLPLEQVAQLLWAAYGLTDPRGLRSAPSAGALYPLDVYLVVGERQVPRVAAGVYHYLPEKHALALVSIGERRAAVAQTCLHQAWLATAPVVLVITGEYQRCQVKYGPRGVRYTLMEAGHVGQNIFLQAEALGLGVGIIGAFDDAALNRTLNLPVAHEPLLVMPVGYK
ncbi:MAG: SagB/ThcOx family dehydrogenase [Desulfobacca sp.]|uniref:SagB/ThcOx family dehydrogenase n=1 Tax=Desulfobacca sp. TaxID=2067990 RepID=UPI004049FA88